MPSLKSCGIPSYDALEPSIDKETMQFHHDFHHQKYVDTLNTALAADEALQGKTLEELLADNESPAKIKNGGGGHWNHVHFWTTLKKGGAEGPGATLLEAITEKYGSFEKFQDAFTEKAMGVFGSG